MSFRIDDEVVHELQEQNRRSWNFEPHEDEEVPSSPLSKRGRSKSRQQEPSASRETSLSSDVEVPKRRSSTKSKARVVAVDLGVDGESSGHEAYKSNLRGRSERAQTPGPPVRSQSTSKRDKRVS